MGHRLRRRHRIILVDDHTLVRQCLASLINRAPDLEVCGEAANIEEALPLIARLKPELVVTDLSLAGENGLQLIERVCAKRDDLPVLVLSMQPECVHAAAAFRAGAAGYLAKGDGGELVLAVVRQLLAGAVYASERACRQVLRQLDLPATPAAVTPLGELTTVERRLFATAARRKSVRAAASELGLTASEARRCRSSLCTKLHLANDAALWHHARLWQQAHAGSAA